MWKPRSKLHNAWIAFCMVLGAALMVYGGFGLITKQPLFVVYLLLLLFGYPIALCIYVAGFLVVHKCDRGKLEQRMTDKEEARPEEKTRVSVNLKTGQVTWVVSVSDYGGSASDSRCTETNDPAPRSDDIEASAYTVSGSVSSSSETESV